MECNIDLFFFTEFFTVQWILFIYFIYYRSITPIKIIIQNIHVSHIMKAENMI